MPNSRFSIESRLFCGHVGGNRLLLLCGPDKRWGVRPKDGYLPFGMGPASPFRSFKSSCQQRRLKQRGSQRPALEKSLDSDQKIPTEGIAGQKGKSLATAHVAKWMPSKETLGHKKNRAWRAGNIFTLSTTWGWSIALDLARMCGILCNTAFGFGEGVFVSTLIVLLADLSFARACVYHVCCFAIPIWLPHALGR